MKHTVTNGGAGKILFGVFAALDAAGIRYCVLHGYDGFPAEIGTDVDCIVDRTVTLRTLLQLLHDNRSRIDADVIRSTGHCLTLAGRNADGSPCFLAMDFTHDCDVDGLPLCKGSVILESRRRHGVFWIPAASIEFGCYLARSLAKGSLDDRRIRRLEHRYQDDPKSCESEIARLWTGTSAAVLRSAARSSDWSPVLRNQPAMSSEFRWRRMTKHPLLYGGSKLAGLFNRAKRAFQPHGLSIVVLGPDGAGKSSVIDAMGKTLAPIFSRSVCWSFAPPLRRLLRRPDRPTNQPHALGRRSLPVSLIRAGYWFVFNTLGYAYLPWTLARSVLVLYDRHFIDIFVDSERYRYGGPMWLLRLIWRFTPRPDLVILLDAPPEVLQARKQEVPLEVTARQCRDYRALVRTLENGRVIDSAQALGDVINDANSLVVEYLAARHLRRHGLEPAGSSCAALPPQQALE